MLAIRHQLRFKMKLLCVRTENMSDRWCCWERMEVVTCYGVPKQLTLPQGLIHLFSGWLLSPATHTPSWLCLLNFPPVKYLLEKEAWLNSGTRERCGIEGHITRWGAQFHFRLLSSLWQRVIRTHNDVKRRLVLSLKKCHM